MSAGRNAQEGWPHARRQRRHSGHAVPAETHRRPPHRPIEHRCHSNHQARLASATRRQHCRVPVPSKGISGVAGRSSGLSRCSRRPVSSGVPSLGGIAVLVNRYSISIRNSPCWSQTLLIAAPKKLINRDNLGTTCAWCRLALTSNTSEVAKARRFGKLVRLSGPRASSDTLQTTSAGHPMRSGRAALSAGIHGKARSSCEGFP